MIFTHSSERLQYAAMNTDLFRSMSEDNHTEFCRLLGITSLGNWNETEHFREALPQLFSEETFDTAHPVFTSYIIIQSELKVLAGSCGFTGAPDADGFVEIGYEIAGHLRNNGYATEALLFLINLAGNNNAKGIIAHTLPENNTSNSILLKNGFTYSGEEITHHGTTRKYILLFS